MNQLGPITDNDIWLSQIFDARAAATGGVVRRKRADVERKVGLPRLELEVRRRGFHMIACGSQIVIVCSRAPVRVIC
ncbi:MAG: N-(5'-phosphoribosyl)anthranilate isomerase [Brevirhabdus sp.]